MHHHAELFCLNLLGPFHGIAAALQRIAWTTSKLQKARLIFISQYEAHHVMLQNATAANMTKMTPL